MASEPNAPRSRRALLTAAAGAGAAIAANAAVPLTAVAADPNDVVKGADNATTTTTSITDTGDRTTAFEASNVGVAPAIVASNVAGVATTLGETDPDDPGGVTSSAGVYATSVDSSGAIPFWAATFTGVYGFAPTWTLDSSGFSQGVWGDSEDVGVLGTAEVGVRGEGFIGVVAAGGFGSGSVGLRAWGGDGLGNDVALDVRGKVLFSRSGRVTFLAGQASRKITLKGVTSGSRVFAVVHSNRAGRYVRAVVPTTGSFTIYLNTSVTSSTYVAWFVIN